MNVWNIAKNVGLGILSDIVPGGREILGVVNSFLPGDKKLASTATGTEVNAAINSLPADQRASLMAKQFDVQITDIKESHSTVRTMLESDAKNPHSTRPKIALGSFHVVAFSIVVIVSLWAIAVFNKDDTTITVVTDGWPFILAVLAPLVTLLHAYFGVLKHEHKNKLDAAGGHASAPAGIMGLVAKVLGK